MKQAPIYLDHAATSPLWPEVLDAMLPYLTAEYGNPSSVYDPGRRARHVVEKCRARVGELIGAGPAEIVFTSGGSESNNAALHQAKHVVISNTIEHESVREPMLRFKPPISVVNIPMSFHGRLEVSALEAALDSMHIPADGTALASFMTVNNELGTVNPIQELSSALIGRGIRLHTDAVQAAGIMDLCTITPNVDYLTISGHKLGGPKGIGALYVRAGAPFESFITGGGQEQGRRAGTENVASIVGMTRALELAVEGREEAADHMLKLRARLADLLKESMPRSIQFNSPMEGDYAPHILNFLCLDERGKGLDGEMLILGLDMAGLYVSAGSACSSGTMKASSVLTNLGVEEDVARGAIRISMSAGTTLEEIERAAEIIRRTILRMTNSRTL